MIEEEYVAELIGSEENLDRAWMELMLQDAEFEPHPPLRREPRDCVVEGLSKLLLHEFEGSRDWPDLTSRLRDRGYLLTGVTPLLTLRRRSGAFVCRLEELGVGVMTEIARLSGVEPPFAFAGCASNVREDRTMADKYSEGTKVEWDWGQGTAQGKVEEVYTQKRTLKIKGEEVTRDADEDNPAYKIEQDDGDIVLKSHSELRKAS